MIPIEDDTHVCAQVNDAQPPNSLDPSRHEPPSLVLVSLASALVLVAPVAYGMLSLPFATVVNGIWACVVTFPPCCRFSPRSVHVIPIRLEWGLKIPREWV